MPQPNADEAKQAPGYEWNDVAGKRHLLGGEPPGVSAGDYPNCLDGSNPVASYAQIDDIADAYDFAGCMLVHYYLGVDWFTVMALLVQAKA